MKKYLFILVAIFSLTACGLKGPLYFPAQDQQQQSQ